MNYMSLSDLQNSYHPFLAREAQKAENKREERMSNARDIIDSLDDIIDSNDIIPLASCLAYLKSLYMIESFYKNQFKEAIYRQFELLDMSLASNIVLLTEYANIKAKQHDKSCYVLKKSLAYHAYQLGAEVSYSTKGHTFQIYTPKSGVVSIHDPYQNVEQLFAEKGITITVNDQPWSGIFRQKHALAILLDAELRTLVAQLTQPNVKHSNEERKEWNKLIEETAHRVVEELV